MLLPCLKEKREKYCLNTLFFTPHSSVIPTIGPRPQSRKGGLIRRGVRSARLGMFVSARDIIDDLSAPSDAAMELMQIEEVRVCAAM
jgi:hypothetical protein